MKVKDEKAMLALGRKLAKLLKPGDTITLGVPCPETTWFAAYWQIGPRRVPSPSSR